MTEPIRILQVFAEMNRGGAETMIMNLYRHIDRGKIQFDFIVHTQEKCAFDEEIEQLGGRIYRVPKYVGKNHFAYKNAWKDFFISHPGYRIIHGHVRSTASIYLNIAKRNGLITIAHSHSIESRGNWLERKVKNIMQLPIRYIADFYFACSDQAGEWLFGKNVIYKDNYYILKNAIEIKKYEFDELKRIKIKEKLGIKDELVIGHVGNFTFPKNHQFLIEIFFEFQKKNKNTKLLLVGSGVLENSIRKKISDLYLDNNVILTGSVSNVYDYMQVMDIFVFPSIFEGLGMAAIEAQASGLYTFVSDKIPEDVHLTNLIEVIPLKKSAQYWAYIISKHSGSYQRVDTSIELRNHGYDIEATANWIYNFYLKITEN